MSIIEFFYGCMRDSERIPHGFCGFQFLLLESAGLYRDQHSLTTKTENHKNRAGFSQNLSCTHKKIL